MKGTAYGVGVGPGDPELITVKAIRLIRENEEIPDDAGYFSLIISRQRRGRS